MDHLVWTGLGRYRPDPGGPCSTIPPPDRRSGERRDDRGEPFHRLDVGEVGHAVIAVSAPLSARRRKRPTWSSAVPAFTAAA